MRKDGLVSRCFSARAIRWLRCPTIGLLIGVFVGLALAAEPRSSNPLLSPARLQHLGVDALVEDEVAKALSLTNAQLEKVQTALKERQASLEDAETDQRKQIIRSVFAKRITRLLDEGQQQKWTAMTESASGQQPLADDGDTGLAEAGGAARGDSQPSDAAPDFDSTATTGLPADPNGQLQFNFQYAPWQQVLEWFAEQAGLSLVMDVPPPGSFNLSEPRHYSPAEALDVINSVLLTKGYTLVRRESMLMLINLEDGIPPNLVTTVPPQELDQRGEFELVNTLFRLGDVPPETAEQEVRKLLGPQGDLQVLGAAKQMFVTETAGRLRTIRDVLRAMEDPDAVSHQHVTTFQLDHVLPDEAFTVIRQMMGFPENLNASADGSVRMATDVVGKRIMVTGPTEKVTQIGEILKLIDVPMTDTLQPASGISASPQLEVYPIVAADSESVLQVLQTLLTDHNVRLAIDPKTQNLIAHAPPSQHALIRATIRQMQQGAKTVEVIPLNYVDPQLAASAINQLFGAGDSEEADNPSAPTVNVDLTSNQLLVRASRSQIEQIRELLDKMGESQEYIPAETEVPSNVRVLSIGESEAQAVLEQLQQIWPAVGSNRIRTVVPSAVIRSIRPNEDQDENASGDSTSSGDAGEASSRRDANRPPTVETGQARRSYPVDSRSLRQDAGTAVVATAAHRNGRPFGGLLAQAPDPARQLNNLLVQQEADAADARASDEPNSTSAAVNQVRSGNESGADIVVAVGGSGLIIASRDREALEQVEQLVNALSSGVTSTTRDFAVFYLKHATAQAATEILNSVLNGEALASGGGAGAADLGMGMGGEGMDGGGGDLMNSLLGLGGDLGGGGLSASGSFSIVPEPRLNMLVVQANASDMQLMEQLLEIIDQRASPEAVQTVPEARLIPVYYTSAEQVATVVREVFAAHLASGSGQESDASPRDFIRALRGRGRGGDADEQSGSLSGEARQVSVSVDSRGNQLVVAAPDDLFRQIETLVRQLDQEDPDSVELTRVITLDRANPQLVQQALSAIVGAQPAAAPESERRGATRGDADQQPNRDEGGRATRDRGSREMQARMEMFRALQNRARQRGGRQGGPRGRGR